MGIIKKIFFFSLVSTLAFSATLYQDTLNDIYLFKNIRGTAKIDSLNKHALSLGRNSPELRLEIGRKCYELSQMANYEFGLIQSSYNIGAGYFHQSKFDSAKIYYENGFNLADITSNLTWKMNFATNLGQVFSNLYQFDSANVFYTIAMENGELVRDTSAIGYLYNSIGAIFWKKGEFVNAIKYYKLGLKIHRKQNNYKRINRSLNSMGSSYWNLKNNILALEYYLEALKVQSKYLEVSSSLTLNNVALLYLGLNDIALAEKYIEDGLKSAKATPSILGEGYSYLNYGDLSLKKKMYIEALEYYNKSMKFYGQLKDKNGIAKILNKIGEVYLLTNEYELARKKFLKAYKISMNNRLRLTQTESLINYCRIQINQGNNDQVRENLEKAFGFAEEGNFAESKLKIYELQAIAHENLRDYKTTVIFLRKYEALKDSLFNENGLRILSDTKEKYEVDQKEKKNNELQHINKIQILELENQKRDKLLIITISIFSFFVIIYLIYRNTERKKRNTALEKAKREVEIINLKLNETNKLFQQSNSTKDKFFSIISHDLKNPFNTLLGATEMLHLDFDEMSDKDNKELIEIISNDSRKLFSLLENLLFWANSQTGKLKSNKANIFLHQSVSEVVVLFYSSAKDKNITIEIDIPKSVLIVFDQFMFSTIVRNLLSNAIKFTSNGGKIIVKAKEQNGIISLKVIDEGVGIKKENLKKLFDESSNYRELGTNNEKGTGLGLILCHDFTKENNAEINVSSELGKGTTFELVLEKGK